MLNPVEFLKILIKNLNVDFPEVKFSPRTHCVPHNAPKSGFKSADLVLYSHSHTDLEVRLHLMESGEFEITADQGKTSQDCKQYITGYIDGYVKSFKELQTSEKL